MPLGGRNFRGFPFDEEEAGAWSDLAARHPDIAARLRQHPAAGWARKRRPASQDTADDFGDSFSNFDRFPFDDIPPEFREPFHSHFNRRFGQREERPSHSAQAQPSTSQSPPRQQTIATQTELEHPPGPQQHTPIPQYGLRNTVDLGQKSAQDPSLVDADDRNQRSMSAPPESTNHPVKMNAQSHQEAPHHAEQAEHPKVRNIPIFVEGREKPVINRDNLDSASNFGDTKSAFTHHPHPHPQPQQDSYFNEDIPFQQPQHFAKAFGGPYAKGQPFVQQKMYPQAYARGASPARSQSPKPQEVPVHHEKARQQQQQQQPKQQQQQPPPAPHQQPPPPPAKEPTPPPQPTKPQTPDPITQILAIQTDVLKLMSEVESFTGTKKDKQYVYLDEMLTRNLIKLDDIQTEGKENIRNARKEAIRCIQKCIAVLEAKADNKTASSQNENRPQEDVEMNTDGQGDADQNGEAAKDENVDQSAQQNEQVGEPPASESQEPPQAADTRPPQPGAQPDVEKKPKKANEKNRKNKTGEKIENTMDVDDKGENKDQAMDVDGALSQ